MSEGAAGTEGTPLSGLDDMATTAAAEIAGLGCGAPDALLFPATGAGGIVRALDECNEIALDRLAGVPSSWHGVRLSAGLIGDTRVWVIEDAPALDVDAPHWVSAFPIWMAAAAGARILVHTSAGTALRRGTGQAPAVGELLRLVDHINLSGSTPLSGLGESRLGPLFPDQTRVHDADLARIADTAAHASGQALAPAIAACTIGPALATVAELSWCASTGADVAVQRLAAPLIAAAHAGLRTLAIAAITDVAGESVEVAELVERAARMAPALDGLVLAVTKHLGAHARALAGLDGA